MCRGESPSPSPSLQAFLFGMRQHLKIPSPCPSILFHRLKLKNPTILKSYCRSGVSRSEEHTSELQSRFDLVCRLLLEKKKKNKTCYHSIQINVKVAQIDSYNINNIIRN